jgi:hypothetical protein
VIHDPHAQGETGKRPKLGTPADSHLRACCAWRNPVILPMSWILPRPTRRQFRARRTSPSAHGSQSCCANACAPREPTTKPPMKPSLESSGCGVENENPRHEQRPRPY